MKRIFHILLFLILTLAASAQEEYLKGRDFWTTSGCVLHKTFLGEDTCLLYIVGDTACTGYVENPNTNYYQPFSVVPGTITEVKVPSQHSMMRVLPNNVFTEIDTVQSRGIHIVTSKYVFVSQLTKVIVGGTPFILVKDRVKPSYLQSSSIYFPDTECLCPPDPFHVMAMEDSTEISILRSNTVVSRHILQKGDILTYRSFHDFVAVEDSGYVYAIKSNCKPIYFFYSSFTSQRRCTYDSKDRDEKYYISKRYINHQFTKEINIPSSLAVFNIVEFYDGINALSTFSHYIGNAISLGYRSGMIADCGFFHYPSYLCANEEPNYVINYTIYQNNGQSAAKYHPPTNYFVKSCWIPTSTNEIRETPNDTNYADLLIYVHEDGLHSTTLNGQPIPASAFDSIPYTNREYWVTQFAYYNQYIPPYFKIENPHGFHADLD